MTRLAEMARGGPPTGRGHHWVKEPRDVAAYCKRCQLFADAPGALEVCGAEVAEAEQRERRLGQGRLIDRVQLSREGAAVERCHQLPHLMRYSVGHHSHDVVSLVIHAWKAAHEGELPRAELITAAHFHDHPERVWGDVPAPVKELMAGVLDISEMVTLRRLGVDVSLTDEEMTFLDGADRVELYMWAIEEFDRGNRAAQTFVDARLASFEKRPLPACLAELVAVVAKDGLGRLPGDLTLEWGGRART